MGAVFEKKKKKIKNTWVSEETTTLAAKIENVHKDTTVLSKLYICNSSIITKQLHLTGTEGITTK